MAQIGTDIAEAKRLLTDNQLVAIPTETVYGLAGNALNIEAITKIFTVKNRPQFDPLIVHVSSLEQAGKYVSFIPDIARRLVQKFWPGPLTLLLKKKELIPDLVTSGLDSVAIRCPQHELTQALLSSLDFPLAAPSANPFGYVSPTQPSHVNEQLGERIKYILDGGACSVGIESTIVGFENNHTIIYRLGGLSVEEIEGVAGKVIVQAHSTSNPKAPGQLKSHYAPTKPVVLGDIPQLMKAFAGKSIGVLSFQKDFGMPNQIILSPKGNVEEAAQHLFTALRMLDKFPIDIILAEPAPEHGLGRAINDRLKRAASA
jgi:L-threonylcarbamoyladenylate synthase